MDEPTAGDPAQPAVGSGNLARTAFTAVAIAAVWVALAWHSPTTTYHLAPLLVVLGPGWVSTGRPTTMRAVGALVVTSAGIALTTAVVLAAVGLLEGPTLTGDGTALAEALVVVACGLGWSLFRSRLRLGRTPAW